MQENERILKRIESLKQELNKLISEKDCLQDEKILKVSTELDMLLNEYDSISKNDRP